MSIVKLPLYLDSLCCEHGRVRIIHNIPANDGFPVTVSLNGQVIKENVQYKSVVDYIELPSGKYELTLQHAEDTPISRKFRLKPDRDLTLIASGNPNNDEFPLEIIKYEDDNSCEGCRAKVQVIHGSPGAPPIDVMIDDMTPILDLQYPESSKIVLLNSDEYHVKINIVNTNINLFNQHLNFHAKQSYTLLATGIVPPQDAQPPLPPDFGVLLLQVECTKDKC